MGKLIKENPNIKRKAKQLKSFGKQMMNQPGFDFLNPNKKKSSGRMPNSKKPPRK